MRRKLDVLWLFVALIAMVGFVTIGCASQGDVQPPSEVVTASHTGMTTVEFEAIVKSWLATATVRCSRN
jgi:hypothetical protein